MTDLLQGKGQKALYLYKILPFIIINTGIFFINTLKHLSQNILNRKN